nr:hypothetical protein Iba_chr01aCG15810 [Ipomoea batatas]GMC52263.1 hypothetical protein Iba_chr01cCG13930 [Ipomoea batatas]
MVALYVAGQWLGQSRAVSCMAGSTSPYRHVPRRVVRLRSSKYNTSTTHINAYDDDRVMAAESASCRDLVTYSILVCLSAGGAGTSLWLLHLSKSFDDFVRVFACFSILSLAFIHFAVDLYGAVLAVIASRRVSPVPAPPSPDLPAVVICE